MQTHGKRNKAETGSGMKRRLSALVRKYFANSLGGIAATVAVAAPVVLGTIGVTADLAVFAMKKSQLQSAVDQAAIAAAKELSVVQTGAMAKAAATGSSPLQEVAQAYVDNAVGNNKGEVVTGVEIASDNSAVTVTVTDSWAPFFAHYVGAKITPIRVHAKASLVGESKVCVIALTDTGLGAVSMTKNSSLTAKGCGVYSNSTNSSGFYLGSGSKIDAAVVCSAGGVYVSGTSNSTKVLTDCPKVDDPLATRVPPTAGACDFNNTAVSSGSVTLTPGVYCGGINISGTASVTFEPGDYVIKNGLFLVRQNAKIKGVNVAFYLTGMLSLVEFLDDATIDLSGAETGDMAGLLFFEDPNSGLFRFHNIRATNAFNLTGTIYLPRGNLLVDPTAAVAAQSAYTAIVLFFGRGAVAIADRL
jgi:Flp pilus assembly protein TadG